MRTRLAARLATLILLYQLGGCASIKSHRPFERLPPAAPVADRVYRQAPPATVSERSKREKSAPDRSGASSSEPATGSVPAQSSPAPSGTINVTLQDNDADHSRAQALLDDANARLARIDRSKLTGENAAAYDQASNLASAARKAMGQHDYLAASGLARKATLVTAQVAPRTSTR